LASEAGQKQALLHIIFHHQSMTAKPIFEIFRAMTMRTISDDHFRKEHVVEQAVIDTFRGVLAMIAKEYFALSNVRNSLLHGTWFVGYVGDDPTSPEFDVYKYAVSSDGLSRVELPRTAKELMDLSTRCEETRDLISIVHGCIPPDNKYFKITDHFHCVDGQWQRAWTWRHRQPQE
jgi:hypothetical protein